MALDALEAVTRITELLERIADGIDSMSGVARSKGDCDLCGLEIKGGQASGAGITPGTLRHVSAADCEPLQ